MLPLDTMIGLAAALCTTGAYVPQLAKTYRTGSTGDLSLRMLLILMTGIALWIAYGVLKWDWVIMAANSTSLAMLCGIGIVKFREGRPRPRSEPR